MQSLKKFASTEKLGFALLSDPDGSAAAKYGVLGRSGRYAKRWTFVIDDKGVVRHVEKKVDVRTHGEQIAKIVRKLKS